MAFIDSLTQHYGRTIGLKLGGEHVVLTGDPEVSRQVLIDQATVFVKVGRGIYNRSRAKLRHAIQ